MQAFWILVVVAGTQVYAWVHVLAVFTEEWSISLPVG